MTAAARRQQEQRELRKQRKRLRDLCAVETDGEELWEIGDVEEICAAFSRDEIKALCDGLEGGAGDEAAQHVLLEAALQTVYQSRGEVRSSAAAAKHTFSCIASGK